MGTTTRSGLHKAFEATPQNTMSSGYGQYGGVGRCFPFWQDVLACYVVNTSAEDDSGKKKCAFALEDYYECLHHKKEVSPLSKSHSEVAARRNRKSCANYDNSTLALWRCRLLLSDKARPTIPMHRRRVK